MFQEWLRGGVLGLIQGLTEFFPVSSSGHLILLPRLFGWQDQGLAFDTVLHLGTLAALLWFFWSDVTSLVVRGFARGQAGVSARTFIAKVIVATIPALAVGFALRDWVDASGRMSWLVAADTAFWALVLLAADRFGASRSTSTASMEQVSWKQAIFIGCAQPIALLPGTSRSGITITAGLFSRLSRETAARFAFFLSIPVTAAAGLNGLLNVYKHGAGPDGMIALAVGFIVAAASGAWAIRFLLSYVAKKRYDIFVAYRLALALVVWVVL